MDEVAVVGKSRPVRGLVLASGISTRFPGKSKLLADLGGQAVITRTVKAYLEALGEVWVVVGPRPNPVADLLAVRGVQLVENPDFAEGQSAALRRGVASLPNESGGAVIGVGDQPLLTASVIRKLLEKWSTTSAAVVAPRFGGRRGNPVVFDASLFGELTSVTRDVGGRFVLQRSRHEFVDFEEERYGIDIDSPEDLARARAGLEHLES